MFMHGGLDAPDRQHVVPLGVREQHRGLDGAHGRFSVFYLSCGASLAASLAHMASQGLREHVIPTVGSIRVRSAV